MNPGELFSQYFKVVHIPSEHKHEDSYCFDFSRNDLHLLAVFDGCGGLGARRYSRLKGKTGAFLAAQTCAQCAAQWHHQLQPGAAVNLQALADGFSSIVLERLTVLESEYADNNKLVGTMVRTMPCTASMALVYADPETSATAVASFNAGDSRVYLLTAEHGLQQLTHDDLRGDPDALMNLYVNAALTNMINIDVPFSLRLRSVSIDEPFAVLTATDGIFGYVRTPIDFENMLLQALEEASTFNDFESAFGQAVAAITGDDATAVMAFYGWKSFQTLQADLRRRASIVAELCARMDGSATDEAIEQAWLQYKPGAFI